VTEASNAPDTADGAAGASGTSRLVLLIALSVALALSIAVFIGLAVSGSSSPTGIFDDQPASTADADRQKVMAQAQLFIVRVNTYGPDDLAEDGTMPDYREGVLDLITPKLAESFEESVTAAEATVTQAGLGREAEVFGVGVSAIDSDSATVLIAGSLTNSYPIDPENLDGERQDDPNGPLPYRIQVELVKIKGEWLVDSFVPVADTDDPAASPSASGTPDEGASP
jgi:hypothetical protein